MQKTLKTRNQKCYCPKNYISNKNVFKKILKGKGFMKKSTIIPRNTWVKKTLRKTIFLSIKTLKHFVPREHLDVL